MAELFRRQWGGGEPLIALHGLFGSLENLGMITRLLKQDFCVNALDLPNHGRSPHSDHYSLAAMCELIIAWMDSVNLDNAHFLGHSLGGKVSMELALRYPERVRKVVVGDIAPVKYPRRHDDVFAGFAAVDLAAIEHRTDAFQAMAPFVVDIATRSFLLKNLEKVEGRWQWRVNLEGLEANYEQFIVGNTRESGSSNHPVLFIKGEHSDYLLPEHRELIMELFPRANVKVIHNTQHWLHAEKPEIFAGLVKRFLLES